MTTATLTPVSTRDELREPTVWKVTGRRVLRSEWSKFWTLRSSWITLAASVAVLVVFGAIAAYAYSPTAAGGLGGPPGSDSAGSDAVSLALTGSSFASLIVGVLGVLMSAGEYGTGPRTPPGGRHPRRPPGATRCGGIRCSGRRCGAGAGCRRPTGADRGWWTLVRAKS